MLESSKKYKKGTRKFKCNPTKDFDVMKYASENKTKIKWFDWLIIKIDRDTPNETHYSIQENNVTIIYNENTLKIFIQKLIKQLNPEIQYPHGSITPRGFILSPDWLGIE